MFKIGDNVRLTSITGEPECEFLKIGMIGEVQSVSDRNWVRVTFKNYDLAHLHLGIYITNLELVTEESESKISKVANLLDLQLDEEFKYNDVLSCNTYKFTIDGLMMMDFDGWRKSYALQDIIMNPSKIIKLPWKPKLGDVVWFVNLFSVYSDEFLENERCNNYKKLGLIYKTKELAELRSIEIKSLLTGGKNEI